mmetsp:Transcript_105416/g.267848  ORF Transcript_105416/g.267848 Transcript_105416/m.267848 type:complete len:239 (+) Transcript_105416:107-823(+)
MAVEGDAIGPSGRNTRLILTSCGLVSESLKSEFKRMLGPKPEQVSMWYIPTALIHEGCSSKQAIRQGEGIARQFGIGNIKVIDPEHTRGAELRKAVAELGQVGVVYAEMGNTYALRHQLRDSGGDALVREAMAGGAIFVGSSAGSIVAGRTVQMAFWKDWDDRTADGTVDVNWEDPELARGLDICGGRSMFPHANGQYGKKAWQDEQAKKHGHTDHEVIRLADGEGFVIDGDKAYMVC